MKKIIVLFSSFLLCLYADAQNVSSIDPSLLSKIDRLDKSLDLIYEKIADKDKREYKLDRYKMYPTENIYNLLRLDTKTGKIDLVQWSLEDNKEFSVSVNSTDLSLFNSYYGTFELYPTKNIYQFILLDKEDGRTWHVQWGFKSNDRWIRRIY